MSTEALLANFVSHFNRAIRQEMDAMRQRRGSFEIGLHSGEPVDRSKDQAGALYRFTMLSADEKLVAGIECTLRTPVTEHLVRVEALDGSLITLASERPIDLRDGQAALIIYPWFLYERLIKVLDDIRPGRFFVERAMTLFGKLPSKSQPRQLVREHASLNTSQQAAVQLCSDRDLAFVWGPPGTGKTTTLAHIVNELLAQGMRTLILSTTNAALDQALGRIAATTEMNAAIQAGHAVRIGRSEGPTYGAALREVVQRTSAAHQKELERLLRRRPLVNETLRRIDTALQTLLNAEEPVQNSLFDDERPNRSLPDLSGIFSEQRTTELRSLDSAGLSGRIRRRAARLSRVQELCDKAIAERRAALRSQEREVVNGAGLVLSTLTNAYFSPLMEQQRFDAVVVDEASMAVLPALFYAACLGRQKTIIVGDPCQLPSIVQSGADYVRKVLGRNIFEVAVSDPLASPLVAMLDVQYRMHPQIGELVSQLFYSGRLKHGGDLAARQRIAGLEPYRGAPLIVLDTAGRTACRQGSGGQSRCNDGTAAACLRLAMLAVRDGAESVAIITPYADQARAIRLLLKAQSVEARKDAERIECSTVHRFQGQERDVIILDTVDADPLPPGVLLSERGTHSTAQNLINVAISRARGKLIIAADVKYFERRAAGSVMTAMIARALAVGQREILRNDSAS